MTTIPKGAREFLATGPFAHIVTLNSDGTPHVSLAWAGVDDDGGIVWSSFSDQRKFDNLRRDPRIVLSFQAHERGDEPLHPYLVIRGRATIEPGGARTITLAPHARGAVLAGGEVRALNLDGSLEVA